MVLLDTWLIDMEGNFLYTLDIQPCTEPHEDCDCEVEVYVRRFDDDQVVTRWESELAEPSHVASGSPWLKRLWRPRRVIRQYQSLLDMMLENK